MPVQKFAKYVDDHPDKFDTRTKRQANLAQTFASMKKEGADDLGVNHRVVRYVQMTQTTRFLVTPFV